MKFSHKDNFGIYFIIVFFLGCSLPYFKTYHTVAGIYGGNWNEAEVERLILKVDSLTSTSPIHKDLEHNYYDSILKICNDLDLKVGKQDVLRRFGAFYFENSNLKLANDYYLKSLDLSIKNKDDYRAMSTRAGISALYLDFKLPEKALEYGLPSYQYFQKVKDPILSSTIAFNISQAYVLKGNFATALQYAKRALFEKKSINDNLKIYKSDSLLYYINYNKTLRLNKSIELSKTMEQIIPMIEQEKDNYMKSIGYAQTSNLLIESDEIVSKYANLLIDSSVKFLGKIDNLNNINQVLTNITESSFKLKDFNRYKLYKEKLDSINLLIENRRNFVAILNSQNEFKISYDYTVNNLRKDKLVSQLWLIALLVIILLIVFASFLLLKNTKNKLNLKYARIENLLQSQELSLIDANLAGQDSERKRIAQELHDGIGSNLARVKLHYSVINSHRLEIKNSLLNENINSIGDIVEDTLVEVRRISNEMYTSNVENVGLEKSIQNLVNAIDSTYSISARLLTKDLPKLKYEAEINIYRILQELISNTIKYAKAKSIIIQILLIDDSLNITYEDDGIGFNYEKEQNKNGIGIKSIKNRTNALKGVYRFETKENNGFLFFLEIPLLNIAIQ